MDSKYKRSVKISNFIATIYLKGLLIRQGIWSKTILLVPWLFTFQGLTKLHRWCNG